MSNASMLWAVDAGNSSIKFGAFAGEDFKATWSIPRNVELGGGEKALRELRFRVEQTPPSGGIACACARAGDAEQLTKMFRTLGIAAPPFFIRHDGPLPFRVDYISGAPGPDRLANAMALRVFAPRKNAVVIDFGTATHGEVVDRRGDFQGGIILPGVETQLRSLTEATGGRLPRVDPEGPVSPMGMSTSLAMRSGVVLSQVGAAQKFVETTSGLLKEDNLSIYVTGGWASLIKPHLGFPYHHDPNFTLVGIMCMYRVLKGSGRLGR